MSVLVFAEGADGEIKKSSFEAAGYAAELAQKLNTTAFAVVIDDLSDEMLSTLGAYGINKVIKASNTKVANPQAMPYATIVAEVAKKVDAKVIVMSRSSTVDALVSRLSLKLDAGVVTNVIELPDLSSGFKVKRSIFTGKAFAYVNITSDIKILTITKNAFVSAPGSGKAEVESLNIDITDADLKVTTKDVQKASGEILLPEADIVVSGGRGLKGPENWHLVTDLAKALGAATGCSKPVSDLDWRPHHEHVGQTGVKVSPNLYIALGISGAIQHLAGVNSSKVIVVVNKDADAPFFKAADYGIVGDVFEVVPKLIEAAKALK